MGQSNNIVPKPAPGSNIYTTMPGGSYGSVSGTSAASAHVAGLAVLLAANGNSNNTIYNQIIGASDPISGQPFGRINVTKALGEAVTPVPTPTPMPTPTPGATPVYNISSPKVGSVTVGAQSPNPVTSGSSATYTITVNRGSGDGSSGAFTADLNITTTLVSGASAVFSPNPVSFVPSQVSGTSTLTISTTGSTPAGSTGFTVRAYTSASDDAINTSTLVVQSSTYIPPPPTNLQNTTGNFWVNHTWEAGTPPNVTNSYNVSVNNVWNNGTTATYNNSTVGPHGWSNITVWAFNSSGGGRLSTSSVFQNTQVLNNAPVANDDAYSTDEDTVLNIPVSGVLGNDTDVDLDTLTAVLVGTTSNGTLTLNSNGSFSYTPNLNFNGADSFTYKANDSA